VRYRGAILLDLRVGTFLEKEEEEEEEEKDVHQSQYYDTG